MLIKRQSGAVRGSKAFASDHLTQDGQEEIYDDAVAVVEARRSFFFFFFFLNPFYSGIQAQG
jgi:hypothetical protein